MSKVYRRVRVAKERYLLAVPYIPEPPPSSIYATPPQLLLPETDEQRHAELLVDPHTLLTEAREQASLLLDEARKEARQMRDQSLQESDALKEEARREGYQAGLAEGKKKFEEETTRMKQECGALLSSIFEEKKGILEGSEQEMLLLSLAVAEKILQHDVQVRPEQIFHLVKAAVEGIINSEEVTIRLHPSQVNFLEDRELSRRFPSLKKITVIGDPAIHPGGCFAESATGRVDATVETQLARIREALAHLSLEESHGS